MADRLADQQVYDERAVRFGLVARRTHRINTIAASSYALNLDPEALAYRLPDKRQALDGKHFGPYVAEFLHF